MWRGLNGELDGYRAKCVMLMIGTNNTWHRQDAPETIAQGVRRVLDVIGEKQPQAKVLLLPIFPFGDNPKHPNRVNNEAANALIRSYADGRRVFWLDFNDRVRHADAVAGVLVDVDERAVDELRGRRDGLCRFAHDQGLRRAFDHLDSAGRLAPHHQSKLLRRAEAGFHSAPGRRAT